MTTLIPKFDLKNGGSTPAGAINRTIYEKLSDTVSVKDFGAVGDGVTDDTAAIQAAITYAQTSPQYESYDQTVTGGGTVGGYMGAVNFPKGTYLINDTITISSSYLDIDFANSVILKGGSFPSGNFAFNFTSSWVGRVKNASFFNFEKVFKLYNPNLNTGRLDFDKIDIYGANVAYDIECRSTSTTVRNSRFDNVKQVAIIRSGDLVTFSDNWFEAGVIADNYGGHFEFVSPGNAPGLELINLLYVPTTQTVTKPCIVKVGIDNCRVTIDRGVYGAEPGGIPLIASYANASTNTSRGSQFTISNVLAYSSSGGDIPMVRLYALPNSLVFSNIYGYTSDTHVEGLIYFDTTVQSYASALAARAGFSRIYFDGRMMVNFGGLPLANRGTLNTLVLTDSPVTYGYATGVTDTISYSIPINSETFFGSLRRGTTYRICITNPTNPGADRYSEYIVQSDFAGTSVSIAAIKEGSSTVASRLSTTGADLLILTNGFASEAQYCYSIQKVADSTEGY
jgi:hypothetical protein